MCNLTIQEHIQLIHSVINDVLAHRNPSAINGYVIPGTYSAKSNMCSVVIGDTTAIEPDPNNPTEKPLTLENVPLLSSGIGHQFAPLGKETIELHNTPSGYVGQFRHYKDDVVQGPQLDISPGEHWINLRSDTEDTVKNTFLKIGNDATRLGHTQQISHIAPLITFGKDTANTDGQTIYGNNGDALVRLSDLQTAIDTLSANTFTAMQISFSHCQGGPGVAATQIKQVECSGSEVSYTE